MQGRQIALVGAFDRYNYGDVLMPIVITKWFTSQYPWLHFDYFGLHSADLSSYDGLKCSSLHDFYRSQSRFDGTVVVGGEVLGAEYRTMLPMSMTGFPYLVPRVAMVFLSICAKVSNEATNGFCRTMLGLHSRMPWIIENVDNPVVYNTVGGARRLIPYAMQRKWFPEIATALRTSRYISVRSSSDRDALVEAGIPCKAAPDSVTTVADCWSPREVVCLAKSATRAQISSLGEYFVFQINLDEAKRYGTKLIADALEETCSINKLKCLLVPVGYAPVHDDLIALEKIDDQTSRNVALLGEHGLFDITYAILSSCCFVGTSLHGAVVAGSYSVPHTSIKRSDTKTSGYLEAWQTTPIPAIAISELPTAVRTLCSASSQSFVTIASKRNRARAAQNFRDLADVLSGEHCD
jgi:hypothetical protein